MQEVYTLKKEVILILDILLLSSFFFFLFFFLFSETCQRLLTQNDELMI